MLDAIDDFKKTLMPGDVALVYYAGHGIQHAGNNYLVPVDSKNEHEGRVGLDNVGVHYILDALRAKEVAVGFVILDACRTNPFTIRSLDGRTLDRQDGLAASTAPPGVLIAYATGPGRVAWSGGNPTANSLYTRSLSVWVLSEGLPVESVFKKVRIDVLKGSNNEQQPWEESSLLGDLSFRPSKEELDRHRTDWINALLLNSRDDVQTYLLNNPGSRFAAAAREWLRDHPPTEPPSSQFAFAPVWGVVRASSNQAQETLLNGELDVVAERRIPIYAKQDLNSAIIDFMDPGQVATLQRDPTNGAWSTVKPLKAKAGFILGVGSYGEPGSVVTRSRISAPGTTGGAADQERFKRFTAAYLDTAKQGLAAVLLRPSASDADSPAHARSLAFSRALAVKLTLSKLGVDTKTIAVELPAMASARAAPSVELSLIGPPSPDVARLTVSQ